MIASFLSLVLLVFLLWVPSLCQENPNIVKPDRLLIATVLDPTSSDVVRDALTLLRSIRLFGGTLNEAVIKVGIAVDKPHIIDSRLVTQLYNLKVEVHIIDQTKDGAAKTLNKYKTFELFDDLRFDYFLWLDADIVVFQDPIPYLRLHKYPGEIQCVPDIYSYMRRYPLVNATSAVWNPRLSAFRLLGELDEPAPHGHCNTGMLLYDAHSLKAFMNGLHKIFEYNPEDATSLQTPFLNFLHYYRKDRFIDSLYFIYVVNSQNIEVSILPHSMNYMAFFEGELFDNKVPEEVILGHFLSDTSLYCLSTVKDDSPAPLCTCVYENKNYHSSSPIFKAVEMLLPYKVCMTMAGESDALLQLPENPIKANDKVFRKIISGNNTSTVNVNSEGASNLHEELLSCRLEWPSINDNVMRINYAYEVIPIDTQIVCHWNDISNIVNSTIQVEYTVSRVSCTDMNDTNVPLGMKRTLCGPSFSVIGNYLATITLFNGKISFPVNESKLEFRTRHRLNVFLQNSIEYLRDMYLGSLPLKLSVKISSASSSITSLELSSVVIVSVDSLQSNGMAAYTKNLMHGFKSIMLESQLKLATYLNVLQIGSSGGMAVVYCCQSIKGTETVKGLIREWTGSTLVIVISMGVNDESYATLVSAIQAYCEGRNTGTAQTIKCVLFSIEESWRIPYLFVAGAVSAVYLDVYFNYEEYVSNLAQWYHLVENGGLLMGSQHNNVKQDFSQVLNIGDNIVLPQLPELIDLPTPRRIKDAVTTVSYRATQNYLLTYLESDETYCSPCYEVKEGMSDSTFSCSKGFRDRECSPAWYLFKTHG